ncbi:hypothetical protein KVG29_03690 [Caldicoprobacter algeriensis]|uniref:putative ABC transporter permease subunit n=1 Tax=Caldicoprobacter algeriensis TaxID=699281 RepID=UPI00207AF697|nr:hypothetical protein [Caldicoprobacter algeriensis]MCM8900328.1 hypothetical protein [Caldicoprobacter algeriensis]
MSQFISLLKTILNVNFGISALRYRFTKEKSRLWEPVLIGLSIILGGGSVISLYTWFLQGVYKGGQILNSPELVLILALLACQLMVFIFGIFYVISAFYFSNDMDILVPLPLKPYHILASKFLIIVINEYLVTWPMLLPAIIIYGIGMRPGIAYWFKSFFILLFAPGIPLVVVSTFVLILMRVVSIRKSKDLMVVIGSLLGLLLGLTVNYFVQKVPEDNPQQFIQDLIVSRADVIQSIGQRFPPSLWATYGLARQGSEGWMYFTLYCLISLVLFVFLLWLGNLIFYRGLLAEQEVTRRRKRLSTEKINTEVEKASTPVKALFWKEWKLFLRTPVYAMNGLAGMIMVPFLMLMPFIAQEGKIKALLMQARQPNFLMWTTLSGAGLVLFTSSINIVACTSISREGQTFWISKVIPVPAKQQVTAKLLHSMAISCLGILVTTTVLGIVLRLSLLRLFIIFTLCLLGNLLLNALNLLIDLLRPKLEWNDPQEAVKQNLNGLFSILFTFAALAVFAVLTVLLVKAGISEWIIYAVLGLVMGLLTIPSTAALYALAETQYKKIEV